MRSHPPKKRQCKYIRYEELLSAHQQIAGTAIPPRSVFIFNYIDMGVVVSLHIGSNICSALCAIFFSTSITVIYVPIITSFKPCSSYEEEPTCRQYEEAKTQTEEQVKMCRHGLSHHGP